MNCGFGGSRGRGLYLILALCGGLAVGGVQAGALTAYLRASVPSLDVPVDQGFGTNPDLRVLLLLGLLFLLASIVLVALGLKVLRVRLYGLLMPVVLAVQFVAGTAISVRMPSNGLRNTLWLPGLLALEFVACRLFLAKPDATFGLGRN